MRMTSQTVRAVEAMVLMAIGDQTKARTVQSVADGIGMSVSYTEQVFARLRNAGLVRAEKGPGGGYYLNARTDNISIADIVTAFEEPKHPVRPHRMAKSNREPLTEPSRVALLWKALDSHIYTVLASVSLADVVPDYHEGFASETIRPAEVSVHRRAAH